MSAASPNRLEVSSVSLASVRPSGFSVSGDDPAADERLRRSVELCGWTRPIVVHRDGRVVDGMRRIALARSLGMKEIPAVVVDWTDDQMRLAAVRMAVSHGEDEVELVSRIFRDFEFDGASDRAMELLAMDEREFERALGGSIDPEVDDVAVVESSTAAAVGAPRTSVVSVVLSPSEWSLVSRAFGSGAGMADRVLAAVRGGV